MGLTSNFGVMLGNYTFKRFDEYTANAMETQNKILMKIVHDNENCMLGKKYDFKNIHSIEDFQNKVPLSTFEDYAPLIDRMLENNEKNLITSKKILRYCSSSGSVGKPKMQPKTFKDIWSMQCCGFAATPGCADRYFRARGMKKLPGARGPLLMSLNGGRTKFDLKINGAAQVPIDNCRPILKYFITTPADILYPEDEENTNIPYFQMRFALVDKEVTYLGSMVITLLSTAFEYLEENWEMICDDIENGTLNESVKCPESLRKKYGHMKPNPERAKELRAIFEEGFDTDVPIAKRIWPKLIWGYGMISSTLSIYMEKLRRYIGDLPMHNMGYAASEGYMAMPVELNASDYVLLPRSMFYEFIPEGEDDPNFRPLTLDKLEVGKNYEIIVTNWSGLYRYRILDIVKCTGTYNNSKKIEFLYRSNMGLNVANEKTSTQMLDFVAEKIQKHYGVSFKSFSYYPDVEPAVPRYALYVETDSDFIQKDPKGICEFVDEAFKEANEKYEKYRRWGMIDTPAVYQFEDGTYDAYKASLVAQGRALNQIKPVTVINTPEKKEFFLSRVKKFAD
ncbi:MAG: GH3 auxin-responsive promoter family protein [Oscillospiraceae bacterium]|nr:GH3 auxin-responsive promoter family protein [Oscillospiraceae bacterium]